VPLSYSPVSFPRPLCASVGNEVIQRRRRFIVVDIRIVRGNFSLINDKRRRGLPRRNDLGTELCLYEETDYEEHKRVRGGSEKSDEEPCSYGVFLNSTAELLLFLCGITINVLCMKLFTARSLVIEILALLKSIATCKYVRVTVRFESDCNQNQIYSSINLLRCHVQN